MPIAADKACANYRFCGGTTRTGYLCATCKPPKTDNRKDRADKEKVYNSKRWKYLRKIVLAEEPICTATRPDGKTCNLPTTDVDHILSLEQGGDPFDRKNCRAWCHGHHSQRTVREDGGFGNKKHIQQV